MRGAVSKCFHESCNFSVTYDWTGCLVTLCTFLLDAFISLAGRRHIQMSKLKQTRERTKQLLNYFLSQTLTHSCQKPFTSTICMYSSDTAEGLAVQNKLHCEGREFLLSWLATRTLQTLFCEQLTKYLRQQMQAKVSAWSRVSFLFGGHVVSGSSSLTEINGRWIYTGGHWPFH